MGSSIATLVGAWTRVAACKERRTMRPRDDNKARTVDAFIDTGKLSFDGAFAGLVALIPMTLVLFSGPLIGLPRANLPMFFAAVMAGDWAVGYGTIAIAWIAYAAMAAMIGVGYSRAIARMQRKGNAATGALFALIPWAAIQLFLMVRVSAYTPTEHWFANQAFVTFAAFVVYGATMGSLLRVEI
ncbi:MAG: hypothetical protein ACXWP4_28045, partial [Polyangiales bacterium]